ncbi:MarR family winged helix-turn-helix transcriptional regulator [Isobaculum melis]|uniref:Transcriptional regulator, MarR family n=1 Tax=Isobaculum melis TaxID=142588 RepID=A0A1H9U853_9LACT|nr:MarR family transcriptional regulator [Isobaculum melis]SES05441.1 transcriptional regulator, MarR family [Isobaculum melis]
MINENQPLQALTVLLRASQHIQEVIRKDMMPYGLNPTEFAVLELLYHKGDQPIQVIGQKILIASSSITYVVDKLVGKNYVTRVACAEDKRVTYASLTPEGRALIMTIFPEHKKRMEEVFEDVSLNELTHVIDSIKKIGYKAQSM